MALTKSARRNRIHLRIRKTVAGTEKQPRLSIYRSNREIYAQVIDDVNGKTLASASSVNVKGTKIEQDGHVGKIIAENAKKAGIENVVFDRGGLLYHGRIKALADSARESGLNF